MHYVVRTANGYVGKYDVRDALQDDVPFAQAYTWDEQKAKDVALLFAGDVVPV